MYLPQKKKKFLRKGRYCFSIFSLFMTYLSRYIQKKKKSGNSSICTIFQTFCSQYINTIIFSFADTCRLYVLLVINIKFRDIPSPRCLLWPLFLYSGRPFTIRLAAAADADSLSADFSVYQQLYSYDFPGYF